MFESTVGRLAMGRTREARTRAPHSEPALVAPVPGHRARLEIARTSGVYREPSVRSSEVLADILRAIPFHSGW